MRYAHNPILSPEDLCPSQPSMQIECLLNPGVFRYDGKVWMLVRVAERPAQAEGEISFPVLDAQNRVTVMRVPAASPELDLSDPRVINYKGEDFLTTMSHLRLVSSTDGIRFREEAGYPPLTGSDRYEAYGIEDCRVTQIGTQYYLTYTAVSANGVAVRMRSTSDWRRFTDYGLVLPPHNKDCTLFDEKVGDLYYMLHRPSSPEIGGNYLDRPEPRPPPLGKPQVCGPYPQGDVGQRPHRCRVCPDPYGRRVADDLPRRRRFAPLLPGCDAARRRRPVEGAGAQPHARHGA